MVAQALQLPGQAPTGPDVGGSDKVPAECALGGWTSEGLAPIGARVRGARRPALWFGLAHPLLCPEGMRGILCATDFSETADRAVTVADVLARALHEPLILLHVVEPPPVMGAEMTPDPSLVSDLTASAGRRLEVVARSLRAKGTEVHTESEFGSLDEKLKDAAVRLTPRLLIIGTHGRRAPARLLLGSFAERTVRTTTSPVLVIPPTGPLPLLDWEPSKRPLKVLAAIDMSPGADAAVAWLRRFRADTAVDVTLVHGFSIEREHERLGVEWPVDPFAPDSEVLEALERELRARTVDLMDAGPIKGKTEILLRPSWGRETVPVAFETEMDPPDLIVVGVNQRRHWGRSTAVEILRGARAPVLCVPATVADRARPARPTGPIRRVLVTTDFSTLGNAALPIAYGFVALAGGTVELVHVAPPGETGTFGEKRAEFEQRLRALLHQTPPPVGVLARPHILEDAAPAEAIVKAVRRLGADLVVMTSHGRTGLGRAVMGSVAEQVVYLSPRPVVVTRA